MCGAAFRIFQPVEYVIEGVGLKSCDEGNDLDIIVDFKFTFLAHVEH